MNDLQKHNAKLFIQFLARSGLTVKGSWDWAKFKFKAEGYMDLSIDRLLKNTRSIHFAMAHNTMQNGDVMADPDMELCFVLDEEPYLFAMHYQNDFMGAFTTVERGNTTQAELDRFLALWLKNLLEQGHKIEKDISA